MANTDAPALDVAAPLGRSGQTLTQRFGARHRADEKSGCWVWTGVISCGYGRLAIPVSGKLVYAHRLSYQIHVGPIPAGLVIDHLCRNTACVNPAHMEAVTPRENTLRGTSPVAQNAQATHCKRGHEFTPENTRHWSRVKPRARSCIACNLEETRRRDRRQHA